MFEWSSIGTIETAGLLQGALQAARLAVGSTEATPQGWTPSPANVRTALAFSETSKTSEVSISGGTSSACGASSATPRS